MSDLNDLRRKQSSDDEQDSFEQSSGSSDYSDLIDLPKDKKSGQTHDISRHLHQEKVEYDSQDQQKNNSKPPVKDEPYRKGNYNNNRGGYQAKNNDNQSGGFVKKSNIKKNQKFSNDNFNDGRRSNSYDSRDEQNYSQKPEWQKRGTQQNKNKPNPNNKNDEPKGNRNNQVQQNQNEETELIYVVQGSVKEDTNPQPQMQEDKPIGNVNNNNNNNSTKDINQYEPNQKQSEERKTGGQKPNKARKQSEEIVYVRKTESENLEQDSEMNIQLVPTNQLSMNEDRKRNMQQPRNNHNQVYQGNYNNNNNNFNNFQNYQKGGYRNQDKKPYKQNYNDHSGNQNLGAQNDFKDQRNRTQTVPSQGNQGGGIINYPSDIGLQKTNSGNTNYNPANREANVPGFQYQNQNNNQNFHHSGNPHNPNIESHTGKPYYVKNYRQEEIFQNHGTAPNNMINTNEMVPSSNIEGEFINKNQSSGQHQYYQNPQRMYNQSGYNNQQSNPSDFGNSFIQQDDINKGGPENPNFTNIKTQGFNNHHNQNFNNHHHNSQHKKNFNHNRNFNNHHQNNNFPPQMPPNFDMMDPSMQYIGLPGPMYNQEMEFMPQNFEMGFPPEQMFIDHQFQNPMMYPVMEPMPPNHMDINFYNNQPPQFNQGMMMHPMGSFPDVNQPPFFQEFIPNPNNIPPMMQQYNPNFPIGPNMMGPPPYNIINNEILGQNHPSGPPPPNMIFGNYTIPMNIPMPVNPDDFGHRSQEHSQTPGDHEQMERYQNNSDQISMEFSNNNMESEGASQQQSQKPLKKTAVSYDYSKDSKPKE